MLTTTIEFIYDNIYSTFMVRKKLTEEEKEEQKNQQKIRADLSRAARRSGKSIKLEGKVSKSKAKTTESRSSKKIAAVKKTSKR